MYITLSKFALSFFAVSGICWILLSTIIFLTVYWKSQFSLTRLKLIDSSTDFLDNAIDSLDSQKKLFKVKFWIFGISLLIGLNILYLGILTGGSLSEKLILHIGMSLFLLAAIYGGIKIRKFRFKNEYQPLIDELLKMKKDFGEKQ